MPIELGKTVGIRMPVDILAAYEREHASTGIHVATLARRDLMAGFSMRSGAKERSTENNVFGDSGRQIAEMPTNTSSSTTRPETARNGRKGHS